MVSVATPPFFPALEPRQLASFPANLELYTY